MDKTYIVAGWYTPDYKHWADRLIKNLDNLCELTDFVEVPKKDGGWEANTLRKPFQILDAMDRNPDRTIIFLDVDCVVRRQLFDLAQIPGDFGVHMRWRRNFKNRSGTMVIKPTAKACEMLARWARLNEEAPAGTVDQMTLPQAIMQTEGLSLTILETRYCAVAADALADPIILHDNAAAFQPKITPWARALALVRP
jgi:hypothetical protein